MILTIRNELSRAAIYFFYDKQGIVDEYNLFMLRDMRKNVDSLIVVINGFIQEDQKEKFLEVADDVFIRENIGFDVWAYKEAMEYYGWDKLKKYDELVLFNFTNFGPVYPFLEMFDEMAKRDLDFWGITKHNGHDFDPYKRCKYGYIPAHIQSSFIVVRNSMLISKDFFEYWENMPMINGYEDSICRHEAIFTEDFTRKGFISDVYVNTDDLKDYSDYPLMLYPKELIQNRKCPIFKRKSFFNHYEEFLDISYGQSTFELYNYLKAETNYDMNLIWDNLLRTTNMYDLKQRMQLNYILPTEVVKVRKTKQSNIALFMHIYYVDMIDWCKKYASSMPDYADIYITTDNEIKKGVIEEAFKNLRLVKVIIVKNRGREYAGFFIGLRPYYDMYDYICVAHGKMSRYDKPYLIGESFAYKSFENVLATKDFVENVITNFDENPRLGLLVPPPPNHGPYYHLVGREWQGNFLNVSETARKWGIQVDIVDTKAPIAPLGGFYWYRTKALKALYDRNFVYEDFPEEPCIEIDGNIMHTIERIYPFIAQQAGYYTGWLLSDNFAKMEITNLYTMLRDVNQTLFWNFGVHDRHAMLNMISTSKSALEILSAKLSSTKKAKLLVRKIGGNRVYEFLRISKNRLIKLVKNGVTKNG